MNMTIIINTVFCPRKQRSRGLKAKAKMLERPSVSFIGENVTFTKWH